MSEPCLACGACCQTFRVSFYWAESDAHPAGTVPADLTTAVSPYHVCMKGTETKPVRCIALTGGNGAPFLCSIYHQRSSTCRTLEVGSEQCNKARGNLGLPPLKP